MNDYDTLIEAIARRYSESGLHFGHGTVSALDEAWWTVCAAANIEPDPNRWAEESLGKQAVSVDNHDAVTRLAEQRITTRQPLAYLVNEAWFAGERYFVDERVLVPRSHLGEWIPDQFAPWVEPLKVNEILDIGTGSGCIAIALAKAFPDADVTATDVSSDALDVAAINAKRHAVSEQITFRNTDLYDGADDSIDLVVSNPPYVDNDTMETLPDEYFKEPDVAFRGGVTGLDVIHRILQGAVGWLRPHGILAMEIATAREAFDRFYSQNTLMWLSTEEEDGAIMLATQPELEQLLRQHR